MAVSSRGVRKAPRQARAQTTVEAILTAAAQLLAQSGTLTTNHIAERAGVSVGTLYQYFADKEGVFVALLQAELEGLLARCAAALAGRGALGSRDLGPAIRAGVAAACAWRAAPATGQLLAALGDADRYAQLQPALDALAALLAGPLAAQGIDPLVLRICLGAASAALECAAATGWLADPARRSGLVTELSVQLLGGLSFPRDRWRAATGQTPAELERGGWRIFRSPSQAHPVRHWTRTAPRQGRARATVEALVEATGELLKASAPFSLEALAARTGTSLGTVYRYFAEKRFALAAFGSLQLARLTALVLERSPDIFTRAPGAAVQGLVRSGLDPLRSSFVRALRQLALEHDEGRMISEQIRALHQAIWPVVQPHPLRALDADGFLLVLNAIDGASQALQWADGYADRPGGFGVALETTAILVFATCTAPRAAAEAVLAGAAPLCALHVEPGLR